MIGCMDIIDDPCHNRPIFLGFLVSFLHKILVNFPDEHREEEEQVGFQYDLEKGGSPLIFSKHFFEHMTDTHFRNVFERNFRLCAIITAEEIFQIGNIKKERFHRLLLEALVNKRRHKLTAVDLNVLVRGNINTVQGKWGDDKNITLFNLESPIAYGMPESSFRHIPNLKIVMAMIGQTMLLVQPVHFAGQVFEHFHFGCEVDNA